MRFGCCSRRQCPRVIPDLLSRLRRPPPSKSLRHRPAPAALARQVRMPLRLRPRRRSSPTQARKVRPKAKNPTPARRSMQAEKPTRAQGSRYEIRRVRAVHICRHCVPGLGRVLRSASTGRHPASGVRAAGDQAVACRWLRRWYAVGPGAEQRGKCGAFACEIAGSYRAFSRCGRKVNSYLGDEDLNL
jgi:hypothetical protein